jgi:hypothetical protein
MHLNRFSNLVESSTQCSTGMLSLLQYQWCGLIYSLTLVKSRPLKVFVTTAFLFASVASAWTIGKTAESGLMTS